VVTVLSLWLGLAALQATGALPFLSWLDLLPI